jgi:3-methylcrotonyl-CoA carboxylase alpha subunit
VRICAEEPEKDFLPSTGKIIYFNLPSDEKVRIDTGYVTGDSVSIYYDSLLAKLIVLAETRESAIKKLNQAVHNVEIVGVATNLNLIQQIVNHADFVKAKLNTHFLENTHILSKLKSYDIPDVVILFAGIGQILMEQKLVSDNTHKQTDCFSPWLQRDIWQPNTNPTIALSWLYHNQEFFVEICLSKKNYEVLLNNHKFLITPIKFNFIEGSSIAQLELKIENNYETAKLISYKGVTVFYKGLLYCLQKIPAHQHSSLSSAQGHLRAPMPGTIIEMWVNQGQAVSKGDKLLVIEAMKMEHTIYAPDNGVIAACHYGLGDLIEEGVELLEIKS